MPLRLRYIDKRDICLGREHESQSKTTLGPNIGDCPISLVVQRRYRFPYIIHVAFSVMEYIVRALHSLVGFYF
jgi:hypothetical protein